MAQKQELDFRVAPDPGFNAKPLKAMSDRILPCSRGLGIKIKIGDQRPFDAVAPQPIFAMFAVTARGNLCELALGVLDDLRERRVRVEFELPDGSTVPALAVDAGVGARPRIAGVVGILEREQCAN